MTALGRACALAALAAALLAPPLAAAQAMQAGLWEITTRVEMAGMPMPPMTTTQCYRDAKPESIIPKQQNCSVQQQGAAGNTLRWTLRCQICGSHPFTRCGSGTRSEERRVGKECRSRWWPDH